MSFNCDLSSAVFTVLYVERPIRLSVSRPERIENGDPATHGQGDAGQPVSLRTPSAQRVVARAWRETQRVAGSQLRQSRPVGANCVADARVSAVSLRVGEQHDGLSVWWQLQGAGRHWFGDALARIGWSHHGTLQAQALPVACGGDSPL